MSSWDVAAWDLMLDQQLARFSWDGGKTAIESLDRLPRSTIGICIRAPSQKPGIDDSLSSRLSLGDSQYP